MSQRNNIPRGCASYTMSCGWVILVDFKQGGVKKVLKPCENHEIVKPVSSMPVYMSQTIPAFYTIRPVMTAHRGDWFFKRIFERAFRDLERLYDSADDGPEVEIIKRIQTTHKPVELKLERFETLFRRI